VALPKDAIKRLLPAVDVVIAPFVYPAAWLLKNIRKAGVQRLPYCRSALMRVGVFPIRDHYYEPRFDHTSPSLDFSTDRSLAGIDWNVSSQLEMLGRLQFAHELVDLPSQSNGGPEFHLGNGSFESGDAEYWYQLIRLVKPSRIFEIGSGNSTILAIKAIRRNQQDVPNLRCEHVCIEPYEMPWLESTGVTVIRKKEEEIPLSFFSKLERNDILFIDSSHVIRPRGDVLFEYLELLPSLNSGVIVHVHDIFTPKDYPLPWLREEVRFWNEQYLLEALLSCNDRFRIIGALNFLFHHHYDRLRQVAPWLSQDREPGSFYVQKI
jgi:hypothetical protein